MVVPGPLAQKERERAGALLPLENFGLHRLAAVKFAGLYPYRERHHCGMPTLVNPFEVIVPTFKYGYYYASSKEWKVDPRLR